MSLAGLLAFYCVLIAAMSIGGGWLPALMRMTHLRTQLLMSFVAGLMLGIATLHLLPHAIEKLDSAAHAGAATLAGIIGMFLLLRAFHVHSHEFPVAVVPTATVANQGERLPPRMCDHNHDPTAPARVIGNRPAGNSPDQPRSDQPQLENHRDHHDHGPSHHDHAHHEHDHHGWGWLGMLFGLGLHTVMDGVALGASALAEAGHQPWLGLAGLGTFLAVALHKPLDAFSISSVMATSGWTFRQRMIVTLAFACCCPLGAALFYFGVMQLAQGGSLVGYGLALSAGFFICIALADLLPEVRFHAHDRGKLTLALAAGILLAIGIESLPGHSHHHDLNPPPQPADDGTIR